MTSSHRTRLILTALTIALLSSTPEAAETGSSHNFLYLDQLNDHSSFIARANLATRDGFSDIFFGYGDVNYRHVLTGPWSMEAGYRHAFLKLGDNWREEYRPMLGLYWRGKLGNGKFSNRQRIEWRFFEGDAQDRIRYRNESVWTANHKISRYQLTPFIEEEFFYDITDNELNTNWLTMGISKRRTKNLKWKLGYRLQSQKFDDAWENRHLLVTGISILIR